MESIEKFKSFIERDAPRIYNQYFNQNGLIKKEDNIINVGKLFMCNAYYKWIASLENADKLEEHFGGNIDTVGIVRLFVLLMDKESEANFVIVWKDSMPTLMAVNDEAKRLANLSNSFTNEDKINDT